MAYFVNIWKKFIGVARLSALLAVSGMMINISSAETAPRFYAVEVSATVQKVPPQIRLAWPADSGATSYRVFRKLPTDSAWGTAIASLPGNATSHTDLSVLPGIAYEYFIEKISSRNYNGKGHGYILAGIEVPLPATRGKMILLVDSTVAGALANELSNLEQDLTADGWVVLRQDVARNTPVATVKQTIRNLYNSDPAQVKGLFVFGHVPVPYSGNVVPDGHPDHVGAWPADAFYADVDGNWTDSSVHNQSAASSRNHNVPGDGKFDQNEIPSAVELQMGRVDLFNMTCFANKSPSRSEIDLLRAYLNRNSAFKRGQIAMQRRGLVCDNFGEREGEAFAASGWRNFAPFFGSANVQEVGYNQYFPTVRNQSYLWSYGTGGGGYYTCNGVGGSDDFALNSVQTIFTMFLGSYFGDWDNESAFLRAPLGSGALATAWAGRPHWFFHRMALGGNIGASAKLTQDNTWGGHYGGQNYGTRGVHIALLGDPSLRMHPVIPPSGVNARASTIGNSITWSAANEQNVVGYHIYRGSSTKGPFIRVTTSPVAGTSFDDLSAIGTAVYMVKTVKLETSGSGTYFNESLGSMSGSTSGGQSVSGKKFQLTIKGSPGQRFLIEASGDFQNWTAVEQVTLSGNTYEYADPDQGKYSKRFFRARPQ